VNSRQQRFIHQSEQAQKSNVRCTGSVQRCHQQLAPLQPHTCGLKSSSLICAGALLAMYDFDTTTSNIQPATTGLQEAHNCMNSTAAYCICEDNVEVKAPTTQASPTYQAEAPTTSWLFTGSQLSGNTFKTAQQPVPGCLAVTTGPMGHRC
jgi:hypothetical protein